MAELHNKLDALIELYKEDEYVTGRLSNFIMELLPNYLESYKRKDEERTERKEKLQEAETLFMGTFMNRNRYVYLSRPEQFLDHDGTWWQACSEDDIQYKILSSITQQGDLVPWKHKAKISLMKQVKQRNPLEFIPESPAIQAILGMLSKFFPSRNSAKYFLTAVGDCMRNNKVNTYIIPSSLRELIREIDQAYFTYIGAFTLLSNFKQKYHGHDYKSSRFIKSQPTKDIHHVDNELSKRMLDLLCIANHYSSRYGSADRFLTRVTEPSLLKHALFLKDSSPDQLVTTFLKEATTASVGSSIKIKHMIFVWKKYLDERDIPNPIFYDDLVSILKEKLEYNEETDSFTGIFSTYLPIVSSFLGFWESTIKEEVDAPELEIDEVIALFSKSNGTKTSSHITDELAIELITHTYPNVLIEDGKTIINHICTSWDKENEVRTFLSEQSTSEPATRATNLYEAYERYTSRKANVMNMSKGCFEDLCRREIGDKVNEYGEINISFWQ